MSTTMSPTTPSNDADPPSPRTLYFAFGSNLWLHQMSLRCPSSLYLGLARLPSYRWLINERGYANVVAIPDDDSSSAGVRGVETPVSGGKEAAGLEEGKKKKEVQDEEDEGDVGHDYSNEVWGMVYSLSPHDESALDRNEGVPHAYTKHHLPCSFWAINQPIPPPRSSDDTYPPALDPSLPLSRIVKMLLYIDLQRTTPSTPREEYVYRMNRGIEDMVRCGVPREYVRGVLRGYIPADDEGGKDGDGNGDEVGNKDGNGGVGGISEFAKRQARGFRDESGIF